MSEERQELKKVGLKITGPRIKILQLLEGSEGDSHHMSAEHVYRALLNAGEDVGLATVYRVLTQFENVGLVIRHNFESGHSVFELAHGDHHDHMVDVDTGDVLEFFDDEIEALQHRIAEAKGYEIVDHSMVLYVRKKAD